MKKLLPLAWTLGFLLQSNAFAANEPASLTYEYQTPYVGAGSITIHNEGKTPVSISRLIFNTNATITTTPWGNLWGYNSTLSFDETHTKYEVKEDPIVVIGPQQTATITYPVGDIHSVFQPNNILAAPSQVIVHIKQNDGQEIPMEVPIVNACKGSACEDPGHGKRILGYYPDWAFWRDPKFLASQIPFTKVNAIHYAFAIFDQDGKISLYDKDSDAVNIPAIMQARKQYPYLDASLSFGGWSWASTPNGWQCATGASPNGPAACFSALAANPKARDAFIQNAVKGMKEMGMNGVDIDWEYPTVRDADNYILLLQGLRAALDKQGKEDKTHYLLTVATPAGVDKINWLTKKQWQALASAVDYVNVMTYDFHGSWDQKSDFMSAMQLDPNRDPSASDPILGQYDVEHAMKLYQEMGVPNNKLVVGVPVYGRMSSIKTAGDTKGLYQEITGTPQGEWDNSQSGFTGMVDYKCIVDRKSCNPRYTLPAMDLVDPLKDPLGKYALTPWGYSQSVFVTYDDAPTAKRKAEWVKEQGFAGVMLWDFSGDFKGDHPLSIVGTIQKVFAK